MKKKVIIIGAGISGLSLAARLLSKGFHVEIYEKNMSIGGSSNLYKNGEFNFDLCSSMPIFIKDFIDVFYYCNKNYSKYFSIIPVNPLFRVFYYDNKFFDFSKDLSCLTSTLSKMTNNNIDEISQYFDFITFNYKKYLYAEKNMLNPNFQTKHIPFFKNDFKNFFKESNINSSYKECTKYISNKRLADYILFQIMYMGASPFWVKDIFNLLPASIQFKGLYYIKGGIYSYIKALERLVIENNGIIKTSSPVDKIIFKGHTAIGVSVNSRTILADNIVCASDYAYTLNNLIQDKNIKNNLLPLNKKQYSASFFALYLALDKKYPSLKLHNIYINKYFRKNMKSVSKGMLPNNQSFYIYCPSSVDSSLCPKNLEEITVYLKVPNLISGKVNWDLETIGNLRKDIIGILSSIKGLEDIKDHIIFDNILTPIDLRDRFNIYGGAPFIPNNLLAQDKSKPPASKLFNLYFTGSFLYPGNDISSLLKSSKICADKILEKYN